MAALEVLLAAIRALLAALGATPGTLLAALGELLAHHWAQTSALNEFKIGPKFVSKCYLFPKNVFLRNHCKLILHNQCVGKAASKFQQHALGALLGSS